MPLKAVCEKCGHVIKDKAYRIALVVEEVRVNKDFLTDDKGRIKAEVVWHCAECLTKHLSKILETMGVPYFF